MGAMMENEKLYTRQQMFDAMLEGMKITMSGYIGKYSDVIDNYINEIIDLDF